jgi:opacity protein-like surface antigen
MLGFALLMLCKPARSQNFHEWEAYTGFDYFNANAGLSVPVNGQNIKLQQDSYGWHGTLAENKTSWIGGIIDLSGDYANRVINFGTTSAPDNVRFSGQAYPFLFGPRFYYRAGSRLVLFGEPTIGGVHARLSVASTPVTIDGVQVGLPLTATHWAYAFGGGADYNFTDRIAFRGQAEWIRSHFPETLFRDFQNNYRISGGIVFKFDTKGF